MTLIHCCVYVILTPWRSRRNEDPRRAFLLSVVSELSLIGGAGTRPNHQLFGRTNYVVPSLGRVALLPAAAGYAACPGPRPAPPRPTQP